MPRNSGVSNVRVDRAPLEQRQRRVARPAMPPSPSLESSRKLSQRMSDSLEPAFDHRKHLFGSRAAAAWRLVTNVFVVLLERVG